MRFVSFIEMITYRWPSWWWKELEQTNIILLSKDAAFLKFTIIENRKAYTEILLVTLQNFLYDRHYSAIGALIILSIQYTVKLIETSYTYENESRHLY